MKLTIWNKQIQNLVKSGDYQSVVLACTLTQSPWAIWIWSCNAHDGKWRARFGLEKLKWPDRVANKLIDTYNIGMKMAQEREDLEWIGHDAYMKKIYKDYLTSKK